MMFMPQGAPYLVNDLKESKVMILLKQFPQVVKVTNAVIGEENKQR